jgi:gluconolactonase
VSDLISAPFAFLPAGAAEVVPAAVVSVLEGPAYGPDGGLYFSDIPANRLMRRLPGGQVEIFRENSGRANGNAFDLEGCLLTCEGAEYGPGGRRRVVRTDLETGEITVLADRFEGRRYNSPNDLCVSSSGQIFFTDPCYGDRSALELGVEGVYLIDPDGAVARILGQPELERPNGVAISPDDRTLYVVDSNQELGGRRCLWAFDLDACGNPTDQRLVYDFSPGRGADGLEVDSAGFLFVCAGIMRPRTAAETADNPPGVYVFTAAHEPAGMIPVPEDLITNCCFAGPDLRTLYITAGRTLYETTVAVAGYHAFPCAT